MIRIQMNPIAICAEIEILEAAAPEAGATSIFIGRVRSDEGLTALTLEHFPELAETSLARLEAQARNRWPLEEVRLIHRAGKMVPGDAIVFVGACAAHRHVAIEAVHFLMDHVKVDGPFWKKEHRPGADKWVEPRASDDVAAANWKTRQ